MGVPASKSKVRAGGAGAVRYAGFRPSPRPVGASGLAEGRAVGSLWQTGLRQIGEAAGCEHGDPGL